MPDTKITALAAIGANPIIPSTFPIPMVDLSDNSMAASGTTKKVTVNQILGAGGTATLASATITGAATVGTTLGVTGVSTFAAGTALLPALTTTGDTNTGIYYPAADTFAVTTGGTERYRVDSSGNVGIGVTPSAWDGGWKSIDINAVSSYSGSATGTDVWNNARVTGATSIYKTTAAASFYRQTGGVHYWFNAPSGTAGNAISFTQAMTLDASGNLDLAVGNLKVSNGKGIDFSATSEGSGTMTSELLNDYEEGTFTATLKGTVSDPTTPVTTTARYTKIGRVVTVTIQFSSVTTTGASGRIQIDGLPFTNNSSLAGTGSVGFNGMATFTGSPFASLSASSSTIAMFASNSAGAYTAVTFNAGTTQDLWTSLTYTV